MTAEPDALRLVPVDVAQHAANNLRVAFHKTRLTREVMVSPDDLSVVLDFVLQAAAPAVQPAAGRVSAADIAAVREMIGIEYYAGKDAWAQALERILAALAQPPAQGSAVGKQDLAWLTDLLHDQMDQSPSARDENGPNEHDGRILRILAALSQPGPASEGESFGSIRGVQAPIDVTAALRAVVNNTGASEGSDQ